IEAGAVRNKASVEETRPALDDGISDSSRFGLALQEAQPERNPRAVTARGISHQGSAHAGAGQKPRERSRLGGPRHTSVHHVAKTRLSDSQPRFPHGVLSLYLLFPALVSHNAL